MAKWEMAKALMVGSAYLITGIVLILGSLVMLGVLMEILVSSYYTVDGTMPVLVQWAPLAFMVVSVGWGGYFIWKSTNTQAPGVAFYLFGKASYKVLQLHRVTVRVRKLGGAIAILAGTVVVLAELIPAGVRAFPEMPMSVTHPSVMLIGAAIILVGVAVAAYDPEVIG